jgi:glycosyltransferase involved in cell wall biosynthesis
VEIVIGTYHLGLGGSESYTLVVAEQLQRLGHDVTILGVRPGPAAELAAGRGLKVVLSEDELPARCDLLFTQDAVTAYQLVARYPQTPLVYVAHADEYDFCTPPQLPGFVQAVVTLNDRIARHIRSLAVVPEVVRLRQPVDVKRFYPRSGLNEPAARALLLGNWVQPDRRRLVLTACAEMGIECREHGATSGTYTREPELALQSADIVFGKARVIVEAMASGRAAYVFDHNGGDGWVTSERYELLEADNFGGQAEAVATDLARLREDLSAYDTGMGPANRDLAVANHSASRHAHELVALFKRLAPRVERPDAAVRELSRLTRLQWVGEGRVLELSAEVGRLRDELERLSAPKRWRGLRHRKDERAHTV